jgi:hypothetical protein
MKVNENPSSGSPVVPCGQTGMTKLIVASRKFANARNKRREQTIDSTYQSTGLVDFKYYLLI